MPGYREYEQRQEVQNLALATVTWFESNELLDALHAIAVGSTSTIAGRTNSLNLLREVGRGAPFSQDVRFEKPGFFCHTRSSVWGPLIRRIYTLLNARERMQGEREQQSAITQDHRIHTSAMDTQRAIEAHIETMIGHLNVHTAMLDRTTFEAKYKLHFDNGQEGDRQ